MNNETVRRPNERDVRIGMSKQMNHRVQAQTGGPRSVLRDGLTRPLHRTKFKEHTRTWVRGGYQNNKDHQQKHL